MSLRELVFFDAEGNVVGRAPVPDEADVAQLLLGPPHRDIINLEDLANEAELSSAMKFFREHPTLTVRQSGPPVIVKKEEPEEAPQKRGHWEYGVDVTDPGDSYREVYGSSLSTDFKPMLSEAEVREQWEGMFEEPDPYPVVRRWVTPAVYGEWEKV